jgi:hypothetical protein
MILRHFFLELLGNKRLRFLISFNLDRYRIAKGRPQKSRVIDSIVDQLTYAGVRFVKSDKKASEHSKDKSFVVNEKTIVIERWEVMNPKEVRLKIAHALRDKRQCQDHEAALARLKLRIEADDNTSDIHMDSHYIAANAMILTVNLTGRESETFTKALLCDAIDSVGVSTIVDYDHEHDAMPCLASSNNETRIDIRYPSEEKISSLHESISWKPVPQGCVNFDNQHFPTNKPAEQILPTWPISVPLQVDPAIFCDEDCISGESSQQLIPNRILSTRKYTGNQRFEGKH